MKLTYTLAALTATSLAANAAVYNIYTAATPATDPELLSSIGSWDTSGGAADLGGSAALTTNNTDAWNIGDSANQGGALFVDFLSGEAITTDMITNGFTIDITVESYSSGGFMALGDASGILGTSANLRLGATIGSSGGALETISFTWNPGETGATMVGRTGATATRANNGGSNQWMSAANGLRLNIADNTTGSSAFDVDVVSIQVTTVPEPSSAALLGLGGLALILRRRK